MKLHIALAHAMIRLGAFIQSSAVMVMSSDDLVEFSRQQYAKPTSIDSLNRADVITGGFYPEERQLLECLPIRTGQLLLLGVGGGREAIPLAQMGFDVTCVDFIPAMVDRAIANAASCNTHIKGITQDISALDVPADSYDVAWLSAAMYSCVPTRTRRVQILQRVRRALKPGGYFACQFHWDTRQAFPRKGERLRQIIRLAHAGQPLLRTRRYAVGQCGVYPRFFVGKRSAGGIRGRWVLCGMAEYSH